MMRQKSGLRATFLRFALAHWSEGKALLPAVRECNTNLLLKCFTERNEFFVLAKLSGARRTGSTLSVTKRSQGGKDVVRMMRFRCKLVSVLHPAALPIRPVFAAPGGTAHGQCSTTFAKAQREHEQIFVRVCIKKMSRG